MKKTIHILPAFLLFSVYACQKSNDAAQISLTPSATEVSMGQQLRVSLSANANVSNWTVTPAGSVKQTYSLTTRKVNYFTFSQPGLYTISVRARNIAYDSTSQSLSDAWQKGGGSRGGCTPGVDTASVAITVANK